MFLLLAVSFAPAIAPADRAVIVNDFVDAIRVAAWRLAAPTTIVIGPADEDQRTEAIHAAYNVARAHSGSVAICMVGVQDAPFFLLSQPLPSQQRSLVEQIIGGPVSQ